MSPGRESREFTRVSSGPRVVLARQKGVEYEGRIRNLSMNGALAVIDSDLDTGDFCHVAIWLGDEETAPCIRAHGTIMRKGDDDLAIEFTELIGEDSYEHLRNLVRYNAADDLDKVEEEFRCHHGIKRIPPEGS